MFAFLFQTISCGIVAIVLSRYVSRKSLVRIPLLEEQQQHFHDWERSRCSVAAPIHFVALSCLEKPLADCQQRASGFELQTENPLAGTIHISWQVLLASVCLQLWGKKKLAATETCTKLPVLSTSSACFFFIAPYFYHISLPLPHLTCNILNLLAVQLSAPPKIHSDSFQRL